VPLVIAGQRGKRVWHTALCFERVLDLIIDPVLSQQYRPSIPSGPQSKRFLLAGWGRPGEMTPQGGFWRLAKCDVPISTEKLAKDVVAKYYLADGRWLKKKDQGYEA
jgi:hypothetical protein